MLESWQQEVKNTVKANDVARLKSLQRDKMLDFRFKTVQRNGTRSRTRIDTPLTYAIRKGYTDIVKQLLCAGVDVNYRRTFTENMHDEATPLMIAAKYGHFNICKLLLNSGAKLHLCQDNHITALDNAVMGNNDRIVSFFLERKALHFHSQEQLNKWLSLKTTLNFAVKGKRPHILELLLNDLESQGWSVPLRSFFEQAVQESEDCAISLLRRGYYPPHQNPIGRCLETAAHEGYIRLMKLLVQLNPMFLQKRWLVANCMAHDLRASDVCSVSGFLIFADESTTEGAVSVQKIFPQKLYTA